MSDGELEDIDIDIHGAYLDEDIQDFDEKENDNDIEMEMKENEKEEEETEEK